MNGLALMVVLAASASSVDEVVVFPDRAQVTRVARASCSGGRTQITFEGIPPAADPASFRAQAKGGTVEGLRSSTRTLQHAYSKELAALDEQERGLRRSVQSVSDAFGRAQTSSQLGAQFGSVAQALISRELAVGRPDPKKWDAAFDTALKARLAAAEQSSQARIEMQRLNEKLQDVTIQRARLQSAAQRQEHVAEVLVACPSGASAQVMLTYVVGGASWQPVYEARADEAKGQVEWSTFATVVQATGEDWKDAKLVLSTALPVEDATVPELKKLLVRAQERDAFKKVLVRREEQIRHAQSGTSGGEQQAGLVAREQGLSVQLDVPQRWDVKGDGSSVRVFVARTRMPAKFAWRTAPALSPFVFRVAQVTNAAPFPLLAGAVDAFRRSGFIGRHALERVPQGGAFDLTFGLEDSLKVKRVVLEEIARDEGLFNQRKRFRYGYRLELQNRGKRIEELEVVERVPVSELDDIQVALMQDRTSPGYELKKDDGLVVWKVKLKPDEERKLELGFHVDVPDSYDTGGL